MTMASFLSFNTDDPTTGQTAPTANQTVTVGPIETGVAHKVAGSVWCDQSIGTGSVAVQQSFNLAWVAPTADGGGDTFTGNWDVVQPITLSSINGGQGAFIDLDVIAPYLQVVFINGTTAQNHLRIFVRVYGSDRSG